MFNLINRFMLLFTFTDKDCYGNNMNNNIVSHYEENIHIDENEQLNNNEQLTNNNNREHLEEDKYVDENKHYEIIKKVRNFSTLDNSDVEFIKNLPPKELVDIIEILNIHIERVNEYINDMEKRNKKVIYS